METISDNIVEFKHYPECNMDISSEISLHKGPWLEILKRKYRVNLNEEYDLEYVRRPYAKVVNGATTIPIIVDKKNNTKELILIANYRIPIQSWILEFPSGLVDDNNETPLQECLRELKEETGYTGEELKMGNKFNNLEAFCDPHKSTENEFQIMLEIDIEKEENKNPSQDLDADEQIKVHKIILDSESIQRLKDLVSAHNYQVSNEIQLFITGYVIGKYYMKKD